MINYFENSEYEKARKQRTRMISIYLAVLAVFVAFAIYMLIFYIRLPYQSPKIATVKWIVYPVTTVFIFFSFLYLGVPYKKIKRQLNFCQNLVFGLKEETISEFVESATAKDSLSLDLSKEMFSSKDKSGKETTVVVSKANANAFFGVTDAKANTDVNVKFVFEKNKLTSISIAYSLVSGKTVEMTATYTY